MRALAVSLLAFAFLQIPAHPAGEIRGHVTDTSGAFIQGATIRVLDSATRATVASTSTPVDGSFDFASLPPGSYVLAVVGKGFTEQLTGPVALAAGARIDRAFNLAPTDCDAPGVSCDIVTAGPYTEPHPVLFARDLSLSPSSALDLESGTPVAPDSPQADVSLLRRDNGLYLAPSTQAAIARQAEDGGCKVPRAALPPVRVDGLGPGSEIILRTRHHHCSRLFVTALVSPGADRITLHIVTRR